MTDTGAKETFPRQKVSQLLQSHLEVMAAGFVGSLPYLDSRSSWSQCLCIFSGACLAENDPLVCRVPLKSEVTMSLQEGVVRSRGRWYMRVKGIPQGSILSTLLWSVIHS